MDINKLQLERNRDQIWALARKDMPLFEKFFNNEASELEATQVAVISIQLIVSELCVYGDEIENISKELLDLYREEISSGYIDRLAFVKEQINIMRNKILNSCYYFDTILQEIYPVFSLDSRSQNYDKSINEKGLDL